MMIHWRRSSQIRGSASGASLTVATKRVMSISFRIRRTSSRFAPANAADEIDSAPLVLTQRVGLAGAAAAGAPALPLPFRDSPEVVAELAGGVDFIAGPTDMKLEGRVLATGEAVWLTYDWDAVRNVAWRRQ